MGELSAQLFGQVEPTERPELSDAPLRDERRTRFPVRRSAIAAATALALTALGAFPILALGRDARRPQSPRVSVRAARDTSALDRLPAHERGPRAGTAPRLPASSDGALALAADPFASGASVGSPTGAGEPYAGAVLADDPAVFYRLDETSGRMAYDSSGGDDTGTYAPGALLGAAGALASEPGETAVEDDSNASPATIFTAGDSFLPSGAAERTVEFWLYYGSCCISDTTIVAYGSDFSVAVENDPHNEVHVTGDGKEVAIPLESNFVGAWHLFDVAYEGSAVSVYLDGQFQGSAALPMDTNVSSAGLWAGCCEFGDLDDVAIYPTALSSYEIDTHWSAGASPTGTACGANPASPYTDSILNDGPVAFYRLSDLASSSVAYDYSGRCADGAYTRTDDSVSGALQSEPGVDAVQDDTNGSDTIFTANDAGLPSGNESRSVEFWFNDGACCMNYTTILSYGSDFSVALENDPHNEVHVTGGGEEVAIPLDSLYLGRSEWHLFDVTYDGSSGSVYLDGQFQGSATLPIDTDLSSAGLVAGCCEFGELDDVAIYPSALSAAEIDSHWSAGASPTATACAAIPKSPYPKSVLKDHPSAFYRLDDLSSSFVAYDYSGHCANAAYARSDQSVSGALRSEPGERAVEDYSNASPATIFTASDAGLPSAAKPRTVEFWLRYNTCCISYTTILSYGSDFSVAVENDPHNEVHVTGGGEEVVIPLASDFVGDGAWHMFDVTYDGSSVSAYLDGRFQGSAVLPMDTNLSVAGLWGGCCEFGELDDVAIYPTALSASHILAHYEAAEEHVAAGTALLDGIACPSRSHTCLAVGSSTSAEGAVVPITSAGLPNNPIVVGKVRQLYAIACEPGGGCFAVGQTASSEGVVVPISPQGTPGAPETVADTTALFSVACYTSTSCVAVGVGGGHGVAVPISSGVAGSAAVAGGTSELLGVACRSSTTSCVAVGIEEAGQQGVVNQIYEPSGDFGTAESVPNATALSGVTCQSATTCVAVGTGAQAGMIEPITNGIVRPESEQELPSVGNLSAVACVQERACLGVGQNPSDEQGAVAILAGSEETVDTARALYAIACASSSTCDAVGSTGSTGLVVPIEKVPDPNANSATATPFCSGHSGKPEAFDAVADKFPAGDSETIQAVSANIGSAPVCRDPDATPAAYLSDTVPPSSWIMLEEEGDQKAVQVGLFYDAPSTPGGHAYAYPFVEWPNVGFQPSVVNGGNTFADGTIEANSGVQFVGKPTTSGTFSIEEVDLRHPSEIHYCSWETKAQRTTYLPFQGDYPSTDSSLEPEHDVVAKEIEAKLNGKCLWIFYVPPNSSFHYANLAGELKSTVDHVPGTYEKPLAFTHAQITDSRLGTQPFVSEIFGTPYPGEI